jgi:hypothetical protein
MINYNYNIPTSGLVQCVDAANPRSYPGSGSTWYDVTGNGHNIALGAGVTYQSGTGRGVLQFAKDSTGYGTNSTLNLSASNNTVISFVRKLVDADSGRTITALNNNWLMAHHDSTYGDYYAEGWVNDAGSPASDTIWRMFTATGNVSTDTWATYANETLLASNSNGSQGPNGWNLNSQYAQYSTCQIANLLVWNRVLTTQEISQVFNAYRGRFGI